MRERPGQGIELLRIHGWVSSSIHVRYGGGGRLPVGTVTIVGCDAVGRRISRGGLNVNRAESASCDDLVHSDTIVTSLRPVMPDLACGTVTFLFTDIEGSTALWERDRQPMAAAVERHVVLLDSAIQAHGGIHFKTVGDAVQAASPTAPAAVEAQSALHAEAWSTPDPLRILVPGHRTPARRSYLRPRFARRSPMPPAVPTRWPLDPGVRERGVLAR
jgi:hypothetical protein